MSLKRVYREDELDKSSTGAFDCAKKALKQGKPVFLGIPDGNENDMVRLLKAVDEEDNKIRTLEKIEKESKGNEAKENH